MTTIDDNLPAQSKPDQCWTEMSATSSSLVRTPAEAECPPRKEKIPKRLFRTVQTSLGRQIWLWFCLIFLSLVSYLLCNQFLVTAVVIQGQSMFPTLREGDHCLLDRWKYHHQAPQRGDLVVLRDPGHTDYAVKRVVALPGESILLSQGKVFINKKLLQEPYLAKGVRTFWPDGKDKLVILGKDQFFVLGDNRMVSEDSRYYGPISRHQIAGHIAEN